MILTGVNRSTQRETCPSATLPITNLAWSVLRSIPGLRGERLATNRVALNMYLVLSYIGYTQKNGAVSKVNKKFISHLTRARYTPSAAATVQVSHVRVLLNRVLQQRCSGRADKGDSHLLPWLPHSPDLTPCDSFFGGSLKTAFTYHHCLCS